MVKKTRKPARRFVNGYLDGTGIAVVWGRLGCLAINDPKYDTADHCEIMNADEARKALPYFAEPGATIYELVPVALEQKG